MKEKAKFIVIFHTDDNEVLIHQFDTYEQRKDFTSEEMGVETLTEREEESLVEDGVLRFEGDPPIEWVQGWVV